MNNNQNKIQNNLKKNQNFFGVQYNMRKVQKTIRPQKKIWSHLEYVRILDPKEIQIFSIYYSSTIDIFVFPGAPECRKTIIFWSHLAHVSILDPKIF